MNKLFKRRGTFTSLISNHKREMALFAGIEARVDAGLERGSILDAAVGQLQTLAAANPTDAAWRFHLGRVLMAAGDPLEAREELEAAAALDPRDPRIAAHLAIWYQAALLALCGDLSNIDLLPLAGPRLCANARKFAEIDEIAPAATLAERCAEWAQTASRFRLASEDHDFLQYLVQSTKDRPLPVTIGGPDLHLISRIA